jgi:hypothetical protein
MSAVMIMVLLADDTTYLLNLMVQSFGYHVQHFTALRCAHVHALCVRSRACPFVLLCETLAAQLSAYIEMSIRVYVYIQNCIRGCMYI